MAPCAGLYWCVMYTDKPYNKRTTGPPSIVCFPVMALYLCAALYWCVMCTDKPSNKRTTGPPSIVCFPVMAPCAALYWCVTYTDKPSNKRTTVPPSIVCFPVMARQSDRTHFTFFSVTNPNFTTQNTEVGPYSRLSGAGGLYSVEGEA